MVANGSPLLFLCSGHCTGNAASVLLFYERVGTHDVNEKRRGGKLRGGQ